MALVEDTLARLSYYHEIVQMIVICFVKGPVFCRQQKAMMIDIRQPE